MFGIVINQQGCKVEFVVLNEDKTPQFYILKDGESIIEKDWQIANSMNKPQWNGVEWIDTEPLPPQPPIEPQKDKVSVLEEQVTTLEAENLELKARVNTTENAVMELLVAGMSL